MNLQDIFTQLAHGELSTAFVGQSGDIDIDNRKKITSSVALGLSDLHARLLIKEKSEEVDIAQGTYSYTLAAEDVYQIERITNEEGDELTLNDVDDPYSAVLFGDAGFTISDDYFADNSILSDTLKVFYRAGHPEIDLGVAETLPSSVEIFLPRVYLPALLLYIAARVHTPIGLSQEFHTGNDYLAKYEAAVSKLEMGNYQQDRVANSTRFENNGWV